MGNFYCNIPELVKPVLTYTMVRSGALNLTSPRADLHQLSQKVDIAPLAKKFKTTHCCIKPLENCFSGLG